MGSVPNPQIFFYMPTTLVEVWFPVLVQTILAMVIAAALVTLTFVIGRG